MVVGFDAKFRFCCLLGKKVTRFEFESKDVAYSFLLFHFFPPKFFVFQFFAANCR